MEHGRISFLARLQLPPSSRLYPASCCPDKDLVVVFSRLGGKDRMSLWKMQGSKKWEVDVDIGLTTKEEVVDLAWSPDCQTIVLIHDPPRISCHSIQDGREERRVSMTKDLSDGSRLCGVWWFVEDKKPSTSAIPDIFKRGDIVTGTAHSVLRMLPLLDAVKDDAQTASAHELFGFQGTQARPAPSKTMPESIKRWPTLPSDPLTASIHPPKRADDIQEEDLDEVDDTNFNSVLAVADSSGCVHCFLDGSYPLGSIFVDPRSTTVSLQRVSQTSILHAFQRQIMNGGRMTSLLPVEVNMTLLATRTPRDVARISSTACHLLWYAMRVVDDLRAVWMGSNVQTGARDPGIKWLSKLTEGQLATESDLSTWSKVDLIQLLATERATDAVSDFIGAGEQMSERGLLKWENTLTSALTRLRDQSQQYVAPACQRLHLALEETLAWSQIPGSYGLCQFDEAEIRECLDMIEQAIIAASWLASVARRQLSRFKEFIKWLRYEINNAAATGEHVLHPRHDVIEVQRYIAHGLIDSSIDGFFVGEPPTKLSPKHPEQRRSEKDLAEIMDRARRALRDPAETSLGRPVGHHSLDPANRNLHALLHNLADKCSAMFLRAASATARSTSCALPPAPRAVDMPSGDLIIRERTIVGPSQGESTQYLAAYIPSSGDRSCLCLFRLHDGQAGATSPVLASAALDCALPADGGNNARVRLLDIEFFDDECLVIAGRVLSPEEQAIVATVDYSSQAFEVIHDGESLADFSREGLAREAMERWRAGELSGAAMDVKRSCVVEACKAESVSLSVNGRSGRRVACVLDLEGSVLEVLDMDAEDEDEDEDEETADDAEE